MRVRGGALQHAEILVHLESLKILVQRNGILWLKYRNFHLAAAGWRRSGGSFCLVENPGIYEGVLWCTPVCHDAGNHLQ